MSCRYYFSSLFSYDLHGDVFFKCKKKNYICAYFVVISVFTLKTSGLDFIFRKIFHTQKIKKFNFRAFLSYKKNYVEFCGLSEIYFE